MPAGKWLNLYSDSLEGRLGEVQALEAKDRRQQAVTVLREVLETYTDVTRFPRWVVPACRAPTKGPPLQG